ncbi:glycosyltransferase family 4 protein [Nocardioides nanhaiensis]|uniref:Glycosyltransferase n=1 Tax=Nocardioides nanhaiensis TaxID=1476871 RepID=A0ABP8VT10_9ACTN
MWSPGERLSAGTGGSENYTVGHVRELLRRGVAARVVTVGRGEDDGRAGFPDVPFHALDHFGQVAELDDTVVFVSEAPAVRTRRPAFQVLHVPPTLRARKRAQVAQATRDRTLIATSRYAAGLWAHFLDVDLETVHVVHPFAEPVFATVPRPPPAAGRQRVLYAGRLTPEKGIYTLLAMLHSDLVAGDPSLSFTVTTAGTDRPQGRIIAAMLRTHPGVDLVEARTTPAGMAALMAEHDVVVMPSNGQYWHETFGIVSIEAQHAGSRVVASDDGGLPETRCGALDLVEPDHAEALAHGVVAALARGPVPAAQRLAAACRFTLAASVDALLAVLTGPATLTPHLVVQELEALIELPSPIPAALPVAVPLGAHPVRPQPLETLR